MKHLRSALVGFETVPAIEAVVAGSGLPHPRRRARRFPLRYLRYWFVRQALEDLHRRLGRPLNVLEVGIGKGKMLAFMGGRPAGNGRYALPDSIGRWDAISAQADRETLDRYSYSSFRQADIEVPFEAGREAYDAVVVLHVLEHLRNPEATLRYLLPSLREPGLLVGGSPTMPAILARLHERHLRRKFAGCLDDLKAHKHLSVISPRRIVNFAKAERLDVELLTGAFFFRASANPLEEYSWWARANLAWGALFPSLGGEVYFSLRMTRRR